MNNKIQRIFTPEGEVKQWKTLAGRVPEFLTEYPVKDGWQHDRLVQEACALTPQLVELHKAAIVAGRNPSDVGLPPLPRGLVFTDRLIDPHGRLVASGSATSQADALFLPSGQLRSKDYEAGESAAFQRLLAALGFGGEVFDEDEALTIRRMGSRVETDIPDDIPEDPISKANASAAKLGAKAAVVDIKRSPAPVDAVTDDLPPMESSEQALQGIGLVGNEPVVVADEVTCVGGHAEVTGGEQNDASDLAQAVAASSESAPATATKTTSTSSIKVTSMGRSAGDAQVLAGMNRNIKMMAQQAGVEETPATTIEEAKAKQANLLDLLKRH